MRITCPYCHTEHNVYRSGPFYVAECSQAPQEDDQ